MAQRWPNPHCGCVPSSSFVSSPSATPRDFRWARVITKAVCSTAVNHARTPRPPPFQPRVRLAHRLRAGRMVVMAETDETGNPLGAAASSAVTVTLEDRHGAAVPPLHGALALVL